MIRTRAILGLCLALLAPHALAATAVVSGTMYQSDGSTACYRCFVSAQQVSDIQGASITYAGNIVSTRTASDGTWSLTLTRSTDYEFRFEYVTGGLQTDPPEIRTVCASATCAYPGDLTLVAGGTTTNVQVTDLVVQDGDVTSQTGTQTFDFAGGLAVTTDGSTEVDVAVDSTVIRTTGAQTLAGVKTFSSIPVLPGSDPTTDNQAARKAYVDALSRVVTLTPDSGTATADASEDIDLIGGDGITTSGASAAATIAVDNTVLRTTGGALTGNLTASLGVTVDGRDLSVDGAKLDLIEAGATADQLAAEVPLVDAGGYFATDNVEAALQAIGPTMANARTPSTHATSHQNGGSDEVGVAGLSGELADAQPVLVAKAGSTVGTRSAINLIEGSNVTLTVTDNAGSDRVDVTIASADTTGTASDSFKTLSTPSGTSPVADSSTDTLNLTAGTGITITGTAATDTIDVAVNESGLTLSNIGGAVTDSQVPADITLSGATISASTLTLTGSTGPTPTADGRAEWDTDDDRLVIGTGSTQATFYSGVKVPVGATLLGDVSATLTATDTTVEIASGAVGSAEIANGSIVTADVSGISESVVSFATNDGSRHDHHADDIAGGTFASARISEASVTQHQAALSVAETQVPDGALFVRVGDTTIGDVTTTFANGSSTLEIAAGAVGSAEVAADSLAAGDLAANSVEASEIATGAVTTTEILDGTIAAADIGTGEVGPTQLASTAVTPGSYTIASITVDADGRVTAASSGSGGSTASFVTMDASSGTDPVADTSSDTLVVAGSGAVVVTGDSTADSLTISLTDIALGSGTSGGYAASSSEGGAATTAVALVSNAANCPAGQYPLGVDASGAVETCTTDDDTPDSDSEVPDTITVGSGSTIVLTTTESTTSGQVSYDPATDRLEAGDGTATDSYPSAVELADASGTVVASLAADSVSTAEIATDGVGAAEIAADAVGTSEIAMDGVGSAEIAADAVDSGEIAANAVGSSEIAADAVGSSELAATAVVAGSYTAADITVDADGRITAAANGSAASVIVQEGDVTVSTAGTVDLGAGFDVTESPSGEANVVLDLTEDKVVLTGASEVTGNLPLANIAEGTSGQIVVMDATPDAQWVTMSGDVAISATGATTIQAASVALATDVSGTLPLANLTDSATSTYPLFAGGGGGDPAYRAIATGDLPASVILSTEIDTTTEIAALTSDDDFVTLTGAETLATGTKTVTAKFDFGGGSLEIPNSVTLPATCTVGMIYLDTNATTGEQIYACTATDTWTLQGDGDSGAGAGDIISGDTLSGDVTATFESDGDTPVTLSAGSVSGGPGGEILDASITGDDLASTVTYTGDLDLGGGTLQVPNSTTLPGTCDVGDVYVDSDATPTARRIYVCTAANTWTQQGEGAISVEDGDASIVSTLTVLDFDGTDFAVTESPSGEGNVTIASGGVGATEIASTAVTPGSYTLTSLTVDADGRITAASSGAAGAATAFVTMDASSGTDPVADAASDTLIMTGTAPIVVTGDSTADSLTFSLTQNAGTDVTADLEEEANIRGTAVSDNAADTEILVGDGASSAKWVAMSSDATIANTGAVTIASNAVALTTDTTGNYAAGDAEAGNALTGDSATAFFSSGAIEAARGGTGISTAASTGLSRVDAGTWSVAELSGDVTTSGTNATTIASNAVALSTDTTGNYIATVADSGASEVTVAGSGSEGAAVTLAIAAGITRDAEWDTAAEINAATTDDDFIEVTSTQTVDLSGAKVELPNTTTCVSTDCDVAGEAGRICIDTDATTGRQVYVCEGVTGWVLQGDGTDAGLWVNGTNGYYSNTEGIIVGPDSAWTAADGAAGDLHVEDDLEIDGNAIYLGVSNNLIIQGTSTDGSDTSSLGISTAGTNDSSRSAYILMRGNEYAVADSTGQIDIVGGATSSGGGDGRVRLLTTHADADIVLHAEAGATDNKLIGSDGGWDFTGNADDNVTLNSGVRLYVNDWIGIGSTASASAACIDNDGADRLYHDTDCDGTKDSGEEYLDFAGDVTASSTTVFTNKTLDSAATGNVLKFADTLIARCQSETPTAAWAGSDTDAASSNGTFQVWDFDAATDEEITCMVTLPADIDTATDPTVSYSAYGQGSAASCGGAAETALIKMAAKVLTVNDAMSEAYSADVTASVDIACAATFHVSNTLEQASGSPDVTPVASAVYVVKIWRDANDASDTYDYDLAVLDSVEVKFYRTQ